MSINVKKVSYTYMAQTPMAQTALQEIDLTIAPGEFVGVIGHTGSGKSTLMQHLNGLLKPSEGSVCVGGQDLHAKTEEAKKARHSVGMVFQYPEHQLFEETIYDDIAFGPRNQGLLAEEIEQRVRRAMDFVRLDFDKFAKRSPFQLSGGQMRRVAIAGVIALEPRYLILDEPSAGLDPKGREDIFRQIMQLHQDTGMGVVLVTHNMEDVARMAQRLIVMNKGKIMLDASPRHIFQHQQDELRVSGLDVPPLTLLMEKICAAGIAADVGSLTVAEGARSILAAGGRKPQ
jgi:energy-coupling factor transport system ATP-binding protein